MLRTSTFDPLDPGTIEDPYPAYARLRQQEPVCYLPAHDVWMITRYDDVAEVLRRPDDFSSRVGMSPEAARTGFAQRGIGYRIGANGVRVLIATDPPDHRVFRQAVARAFSPQSIDRLRTQVEQQARRCVRTLLDRSVDGDADAVRDLTAPLPAVVLASLFDVPQDMHDQFRRWADDITRDLDSDVEASGVGRGMSMFRYFRDQLARGRSSDRPSLFRDIAAGGDTGISDHELLAFCAFLLVAGVETTANLLSNLVRTLATSPGLQRQLRQQPQLIPRAVEEALRHDTSVQALWRGTTRPVELGGRRLDADQRLLVCFGSANRDPARFPDPDAFSLQRDPSGHLAFGAGPHFCLGARLAQMELVAAVRALIEATTDLELAGQPQRTNSLVLRGHTHLPVTVQPSPAVRTGAWSA